MTIKNKEVIQGEEKEQMEKQRKYPQIESFDDKKVVILGDNLYIENKGNSIIITNEEKVMKKKRQKYFDGEEVHCDFCKEFLGVYKHGWELKVEAIQRGQGKGERLLNFCNKNCADKYKLKQEVKNERRNK